MKLVELLAREISEWPEEAEHAIQDDDGCFKFGAGSNPKDYADGIWVRDIEIEHELYNGFKPSEKTIDRKTAIVTRAQWQAARDRQKGGEWKRHRGGKQPVADDVRVEVKLRDGDIQEAKASAFLWNHSDCDVYANIMQYRIISQPQAEHTDWVGPYPCATSDSNLNEVELAISYPSGVCSMEAKTEQMETPFKWRDEVTELNAYIEKYTRERDALIERLASEGFALIPPMVTAKPDGLPFEEWQVGDIVEVTNVAELCNEEINVGDQLPIVRVDKSDDTVSVGVGTWSDTGSYKFIRRP